MKLDLLSIQEVADRFDCSRQQVYKYIADGRLPTVQIGNRIFVERKHAKKPEGKKPGPKAADHRA